MSSPTFTTSVVAKLLDLTAARVGQLAKDGVIDKPDKGRYPAKVIPQYIKWLRSGGKKKNTLDLNRERAKLTKKQIEKTEIQIEEMKTNLVNVEDVEKTWAKYITACRAKLLSMPTKMASEVVMVNNLREAQGIINKYIREALTELAKS